MMGTHRRILHKARWGIAVGGWFLGSLAWAQSAIESVSGSIQGGTEVVRIELSEALAADPTDRKSTRLNSSHGYISYAVFCLKKKKLTAPCTVRVKELLELEGGTSV